MKYGYYSDNNLKGSEKYPFRCPSWEPLPDGKKNVVMMGCSHTWGVGLEPHETWAHHVSQHNTKLLRYWNLGQPGASADSIVRMLYSCEKVLFPKIIIVMWPGMARRERLDKFPQNLLGTHKTLKHENANTDINNFFKGVFFVEKFAEKNGCKTFHCFSDLFYDFSSPGNSPPILAKYTLRNCWPYWDTFTQRQLHGPSVARDGVHYGVENHKRFAEIFLEAFGSRLK